jgi:hypothetical protein
MQTDLQKALIHEVDIILVVVPEIMSPIQNKTCYFKGHAIIEWLRCIWFYLTEPANAIQFMAITEDPEISDYWNNVPVINEVNLMGQLLDQFGPHPTICKHWKIHGSRY